MLCSSKATGELDVNQPRGSDFTKPLKPPGANGKENEEGTRFDPPSQDHAFGIHIAKTLAHKRVELRGRRVAFALE